MSDFGFAAMDDYYGDEYDDLYGREDDSSYIFSSRRIQDEEDDRMLDLMLLSEMADAYDDMDMYEMGWGPGDDDHVKFGSERHGFMKGYCSILSALKYAKEDRHNGAQSGTSHRGMRTRSRSITFMKHRVSRLYRKVSKEITTAAVDVYMGGYDAERNHRYGPRRQVRRV